MKITKGKKSLPYLVLIHGVDGVGKSTLASEFPSPIFIGPELGTFNIDVAGRVEDIKDYDEIIDALRKIHEIGTARYRTIVIDSLDWCETMLIEKLSEQNLKNYEVAAQLQHKFFEFSQILNKMRMRGHNIVLICHSTIAEFNDPVVDRPYNRYELKLYKNKYSNVDIRGFWREFVDCVLFLNHETITQGKNKEVRGTKTDRVVMHLKPSARWEAKNRFGVDHNIVYNLGSGYRDLSRAFKKEISDDSSSKHK